jgi:integrase
VRQLRDEQSLQWDDIARRLDMAAATAVYLYRCAHEDASPTYGIRRAIIATLALGGPRVTELCLLDNLDVDLAKAKFHVRDSKTEAGVRSVDIHPRLLNELTSYRAYRGPAAIDAPAFPTRSGTRRNKDNVRQTVIQPVVALANTIRAHRDDPPIRTHVTPHTFRRTYITYAIAAGFDIPYVQAQVGHSDPKVTLAVYAQVMRRPDRDQLRAEIRALLGIDQEAIHDQPAPADRTQRVEPSARLQAIQKAAKGRSISL